MIPATAYHEAGHAVAAAVLAVPFDYCATYEANPRMAGEVRLLRGTWDGCDQRAVLILTVAGVLAERRAGGNCATWDRMDATAGTDWSYWRTGIQRLAQQTKRPPGELCEELVGEAQRLVRDHWPAIRRVAAALQQHGVLWADEVKGLLHEGGEHAVRSAVG